MTKKQIQSPLRPVERRALSIIQGRIAQRGAAPSVRELSDDLGFASTRSGADVIDKLIELGFLKRRKDDRSLQLIRMPEGDSEWEGTISVPVVGRAACGAPLLAEENIEGMIRISTRIAKPSHEYFLLRAEGDSMTEAGIEDGSLVLVRRQATAETGDIVVALVDDEATIKVFQKSQHGVVLLPRSKNPKHRPIIVHRDFQIQGVFVASMPEVPTLLISES